MGLSTQIAARPVYLTDGRSRTVQVGGQTIELRHASPRSMAGAGRTEGAVIQALRHLGPNHIDASTIQQLRHILTVRDKVALQQEVPNAPSWQIPTLQEICRPD